MAALQVTALTGCYDHKDRCLDAGGRWLESEKQCVCTEGERAKLDGATDADQIEACRDLYQLD